jgi:DNA-binding protein Fis
MTLIGIHRSLLYKKLKKFGIALKPERPGRG